MANFEAFEKSIKLAVGQVNQEGGLDGESFGVVLCNTDPTLDPGASSSLEIAVDVAAYLTDTLGVPAILGPASSAETAAVFESLRGTGTLVFSPSATSPALTTADEVAPTDARPGMLWRTAPPDSLQGRAIAQDVLSRSRQSVAIVAQSGAYGEGLTTVFLENYGDAGAIERSVFSEAAELQDAIDRAAQSSAQEVLFISSAPPDIAVFLGEADTNPGFDSKGIFLPESAASQDLLVSASADTLSRVRGTRPSLLSTRDPVFSNFLANYTAQYGEDASLFSFTAQAYDMAWLAMLGVSWATDVEGEATGLGLARGLRKVSDGPEFALVPSNWNSMRQRFRSGQGLDVAGASGPLDFDPTTEEVSASIDVWRVNVTIAPQIVVDYVVSAN